MQGKKISRRAFLSTAAGVAGLMLAACKPAEVEKVVQQTVVVTEPGEVVETVVTATPAPALSGNLEIWAYTNVEDDVEQVYKPMMAKFNEIYPNIQANFDIQGWDGRREKLYAAVAAGSPPDIWYSNTDTLLTYVEKNVAAPLNDILTPDLLTDQPESILDGGTFDGKLYVICNWLFILGYGYNGELMEECGYDPAQPSMTWDELLALGETAKSKGYYLEHISLNDWSEWLNAVHAAGGTVYNDDLTTTNLTKQPAIDALTLWVEEYKQGYVPLEYAVAGETGGGGLADYFIERKQLMKGHFWATDCETVRTTDPTFPIRVGGPRQKDASSPLTSGASGGSGWSMTQLCKQKEAAGEWIKFMVKPENIGLWCTLSQKVPSGELAQKYWTTDACTSEFIDRNVDYLFAGPDVKVLWQESKTICAPHFQAAVLGQATVEQALEECDKELTALLKERYGGA